MKQSVYLETTVISYYIARFSRDLIVAGHQQITREWIDKEGFKFEIFISEAVINECANGDKDAAQSRIELLTRYEILALKPEVLTLAEDLVRNTIIPKNYSVDALHISIATVNGMDYLLTWNCKHIANAQIRNVLEKSVNKNGYALPIICTPEELMGE